MIYLEKMVPRTITSANYTTSVNGMVHPDRVLPEHDFLYVLDGEWEIMEEGVRYDMRTDDLLILCAGHHHYGEKLCNPGNRHMYFHVLPSMRERLLMDKMEGIEEEAEKDFFQSSTLVHCQGTPRVRQYFTEVISAYWSEDAQRRDRLTLLFNLFLCELISLQSGGNGGSAEDPIVEQARRKIHSNPQISWTAREMADCFYICPRTLNNHFQRASGRTFAAYQMDMKLEMVREFLLNQPDAKLHEAAVNFGFYDEFHLSKAFKKKYGQPPSKVR